MIPSISQATTLSTSFEEDLIAYAQAGWSAVELWLTKLEAYLEGHTLSEVAGMLSDSGLTALSAAGQGGLLQSQGAEREAAWEHFRRRLGLLQSLRVPVLVLGVDFPREPRDDGLRRAIDSLQDAAVLAEAHGVRLAVEPHKDARFCASLDTAAAVVAQCPGPASGICLDVFHYYCGASKFEDLGHLTLQNLLAVHLSDLAGTPRELAGDSDRILPGEGDFQLEPILTRLHEFGYRGPVVLEVLNPALWRVPAGQFADLGLRAVCRVLEKAGITPARPGGLSP